MKPRILVSACLLGRPVRYDGSAKSIAHSALERWNRENRLVPLCPELAAGFGTPRPPAEIFDARDGAAVLDGEARVVERESRDVTDLYVAGARHALRVAVEAECRFALLTDGSPSCGSRFIYDGSFNNRKHAGVGVTVALLRRNGIEVFPETEIETLEAIVG